MISWYRSGYKLNIDEDCLLEFHSTKICFYLMWFYGPTIEESTKAEPVLRYNITDLAPFKKIQLNVFSMSILILVLR